MRYALTMATTGNLIEFYSLIPNKLALYELCLQLRFCWKWSLGLFGWWERVGLLLSCLSPWLQYHVAGWARCKEFYWGLLREERQCNLLLKNLLFLRDSSAISMRFLCSGQRSCLLQHGYMHTRHHHWFLSSFSFPIWLASWLAVHIPCHFINLNWLHWSIDFVFGALCFCFCWWKFIPWDASLSHCMCPSTALQLGCILMVI